MKTIYSLLLGLLICTTVKSQGYGSLDAGYADGAGIVNISFGHKFPEREGEAETFILPIVELNGRVALSNDVSKAAYLGLRGGLRFLLDDNNRLPNVSILAGCYYYKGSSDRDYLNDWRAEDDPLKNDKIKLNGWAPNYTIRVTHWEHVYIEYNYIHNSNQFTIGLTTNL